MKAHISEKADGLPVERQKLVYKGRTMQDSCKLAEYNLEEGCKVHLILQKTSSTIQDNEADRIYTQSSLNEPHSSLPDPDTSRPYNSTSASKPARGINSISQTSRPMSKFETILRERLAEHFCPQTIAKIMNNLQEEIDRDINSSSLDDLERLAKQKLNISNE